MHLVGRTTLLAVAMLIAILSLVATTTVNAQVHEDPGLTVTVTETEAGVILTIASVDPGVTLTVTLEDDGVSLDVISKDPGVKVKVKYKGEGVTLTAKSADRTATLEVVATAYSVTWERNTPDYEGMGIWP